MSLVNSIAWAADVAPMPDPEIDLGDTFAHDSEPSIAWEVTDLCPGHVVRLASGGLLMFRTTLEILSDVRGWKRCEARAVLGRKDRS